jgi:hypothetical protein
LYRVRRRRYTLSEFLPSFFSCPFSRLLEKPSEKDPMEQYVPTRSTAKSGMRGVGRLELGGLLLACLSPPSCRRRKRRPVRAPFWRGADAHVPGYRSRSVQARGPNSAASSTSGSLWAVSPCRWSGRRDGANLALVVLGRLSRPLVSGRSLTVVALVVTPQ